MRKAQSLTAYIIIGLILLIGFGIVFSIVYSVQKANLEPISYPQEVQPIANFVTQCIEQEGTSLIELAANQGGFIDIPPFIAYETDSHLTLDNLGLQILPYWTVPGEERIPPLDYITNSLSVHLVNDTLRCLDNFQSFSKEYEIRPVGPLVVDTQMGEENVAFQVNYPLVIVHKSTGTQFDLDKFVGFVPIRFKKMYELAAKVMRFVNDEQIIENTTINLMASDQKIPMDGLTFECGGTIWPLFQIKERLQRSVAQNLGTIRIKNTNYEPFEMDESVYEDLARSRKLMIQDLNQGIPLQESRNLPRFTPSDAWEYFHTFYDVGADRSELKVIFDYNPDYGMNLNAQPNDNGVLNTKQMRGAGEFLQFLCVNNYHFTYDVQFPMKVGIVDPVSNYGRGAIFQFAFPVLIDDNTPSRSGLTESIFPVLEPNVGYCDTLSTRVVDLRARGYYQAGLPAQELKDVEMNFVCVNRECELGATRSDQGVYRLKTAIPACSNPLIKAKKEGYVSNEKVLDENMMVIELTKLKKMNLEVVRHRYRSSALADPTLDPLQEEEPLGNDEQVTIYLTDKKTGHSQYKTFPGDTDIDIIDDTATYKIQMILIDEDENILGGYLADDVTLSYDEISKGNTLKFNVFEYTPYPRTDDDKTNMMIYLGQADYKEKLRPTVSG